MGVRIIRTILVALFVAQSAIAATPRRTLKPVPLQALVGDLRSNCAPVIFNGDPVFSRLSFRLDQAQFRSLETLYRDPKCEISFLETRAKGQFRLVSPTELRMRATQMELRALDPRFADSLHLTKACGHSWENGVFRQILGTDCARSSRARYFLNRKSRGIEVLDCAQGSAIGPQCNRYQMSKKRAKTQISALAPSAI